MSIVQQVHGQATTGGSPLILPNPVSAGNTLIAAIAERGGISWDFAAEGWTACPDGDETTAGFDAIVIVYKHTLGTESQAISSGPLIYNSGAFYEVAGTLYPGAPASQTGVGFTLSSGSIAAAAGFTVGIGGQGVGGGYDSVAGSVTYAIGAGWTKDHDNQTVGGGHPTVVVGHRSDAGYYDFSAFNAISGDAWAAQIVTFAGPPPPPEPGLTLSINDVDITDAFEKNIRVELDGTGNGSFKINRHSAQATASNLTQGNVVKVRYDRISPDPIFAFFLEDGDFGLVSTDEEGGENLTFGGRGVRSILRRAIMWGDAFLATKVILNPPTRWVYTASGGHVTSRTLVTTATPLIYDVDLITTLDWPGVWPDTKVFGRISSGPYSGKFGHIDTIATPVGGVGDWNLYAFSEKPGAILWRIITEAKHASRPQHPLAALTIDFTETLDSDGNAWASADGMAGFTLQVGENLDDICQRLIDTGAISVVTDPDLTMHAYNTYGRDLHGVFASNHVRFERGVNIADALQRSRGPELPATHILVEGDGEIVATAALADEASRPTVEIFASLEGSDTTNLADAGENILDQGVTRLESARFPIEIPKDDPHDPSVGDYVPGPPGTDGDFWVGDLVTLHTGTSTIDYNARSATVTAITLSEDDAANLQVVPEVDSIFHDARPRRELRYGRHEGSGSGVTQGRGVIPGRVLTRSPSSGSVGDALIPGADLDVTAADVSYDNTTSGLTAADVQAAIDEIVAGGSGATLLDILGWYDAIVDGGLAGDGSTDDTTALTNLIATATASGTKSATIYFPGDHVYKLAGNVTFPAVSLSNPQITIEFVGARRPPFQPNGSIPNPAGYSILRGTATTGTATINGGTSPTNNNIVINIRNLLCIANDNPTITFWNLEMTYSGIIEGLMISVTPWTTAPTYPTHSSVYGVTLPQNLHSNGQQIDGLQIGGFYTCLKLGELERGRNIILGNCRIGMESNAASHSGFIESLQITAYTYGLYATGTRYLDILNFDTERTAGTFATTADIYDPSNQLNGYVRWFEITSGVGAQHLFTVTGGANLLTQEIGPAWGASATSFATPSIVLGTAAAAGAATTAIRSDSTIVAFDATAPTTSAIGDSAATGSQAVAARRDHRHGREALSTATPLVESGAGAVGTGTKSSREDHVHPAATVAAAPRILLADGHATPFAFTDLLQMDDGSDFLWSDP